MTRERVKRFLYILSELRPFDLSLFSPLSSWSLTQTHLPLPAVNLILAQGMSVTFGDALLLCLLKPLSRCSVVFLIHFCVYDGLRQLHLSSTPFKVLIVLLTLALWLLSGKIGIMNIFPSSHHPRTLSSLCLSQSQETGRRWGLIHSSSVASSLSLILCNTESAKCAQSLLFP